MENVYRVVSYPKAGRTWLRVLLCRYFTIHFNIATREKRELLRPYLLCKYNKSIPIVHFSHFPKKPNGFEDETAWLGKARDMDCSKKQYKNESIILLSRDPRDIIVSSYFHKTRRAKRFGREPIFKGSLNDYVFQEKGNIDCIIKYYNDWMQNIFVPKKFCLVRYEDLHKNPKTELKKLLNFLGLFDVDMGILDSVIEHASFANMRLMETQNCFDSRVLSERELRDVEAYKVRRGKPGGYLDYLSSEALNYLNNKLKDLDSRLGIL